MTALGFSLLYEPAAISVIDHLSPGINRLIALALLFGVGTFLAWSWLHPKTIGKSRWLVRLPSGPLVLLQIIVGLLDLTAAARLEAGDKSGALEVYKTLADDLAAPQGTRARAAEMAAALAS